jgi:hypothetical protein
VNANLPALISRINAVKAGGNAAAWENLRTEGVIDPDADIASYNPNSVTYALDHVTPVARLWNDEGYDSDDNVRRGHFLRQSNWQILTQRANSAKSSGGVQYRRWVGVNFVSSIADGGVRNSQRINGERFWDASNQPI